MRQTPPGRVYLTPMRRRAIVLLAMVTIAICAAVAWWLGRDALATNATDANPAPVVAADADDVARAGADPSHAPPSNTKKRRVTKAEREAVRDKILDGIRAAQSQPRRDTAASPAAPADAAPSDAEGGEPGTVTDRSDGKLTSLLSTINDDFMPLANECYAQALQTEPELGGMLDLGFSVIADEDVGGLVDEIEVGEENEIHNAGMIECIRETMLSTYFPSPAQTGQQDVRLTLRFEPDEP